ncbi:Diacylglycerol kinase catalytic region [Methylocella tundrae]|uniref:Diacylglycerol kinase catalytic region n=2 Tax=Methylocella tundrae TaxID=227605 RepID=A0A4U8Z2J3_METTU|nr:diacylglycerol kinase family protein [Methylocella tundrae]VFU09540.1 Diacylglycerol kinase catalytic region [Methylocella tundrae]
MHSDAMNAETLPNLDAGPFASPRFRRIAVVVNTAGGGVGPDAAAEMEAILAHSGAEIHLASVEPKDIDAAVRAAVETLPDLLVTLAGDGTARLAAELCGPDGPLLAPLPGGTMNMLPHALYGERDWREALASALSTGLARPYPGGTVGGRPFYVAAILGAPALWAPAREAVRYGNLKRAFLYAQRALARAFTGRLSFELDQGPRVKAEALMLISPLISELCPDHSALEAIALDPHHALEACRIGVNALLGDFRSDPAVSAQFCQSGRALSRRAIPCLLDGELHRLDREVEFKFLPRAFRALVPAPDARPH